jgi:transcriptional regulator with XRE-family HTH domain
MDSETILLRMHCQYPHKVCAAPQNPLMGKALAQRIVALMEKRGIESGSELARRADVTQSTVSRLLHEGTDPTLSVLRRIARVLRVTVSQLIGEAPIEDDDDVAVVLMAMQDMPSYKRGALRTAAERLKSDP